MTDTATARIPSIPRRAFLGGSATAAALGAFAATGLARQGTAHARPGDGEAGTSASSTVPMTVGRGMADMTGEPLGAGMNGYAVLEQQTSGLRQRQFARAFVFDDGNGGRVAHVTADMGLMFQSIQLEVIRRLQARFGDTYHEGNVLIGASHTHVAPGVTSGHLMVDLTTLGFRPVTFYATVTGIVLAIERRRRPGAVADRLTRGTSPTPASTAPGRLDKQPRRRQGRVPRRRRPHSVTLTSSRRAAIGLINWYGIHPTTFGPTPSSPATTRATRRGWRSTRPASTTRPREAPYVGGVRHVHARRRQPQPRPGAQLGPGEGNEYESARILGRRQLDGVTGRAVSLGGGGPTPATSGEHARSQDRRPLTRTASPAPPARRSSARRSRHRRRRTAAANHARIQRGLRGGTPWVRHVNQVAVPASASAIHGAKENLLPVGYIPGLVQQTHVFHLHRIGGIVIASLAFEPTVVAGLRMRRAIAEALDVPMDVVIVQGYVSGYGHYITTPEEYEQQDYEGSATIFGRLTLPAATQIFDGLAAAMRSGVPVDAGAPEGDLTGKIPPSPLGNPLVDVAPLGKNFGDVLSAPEGPVAGGTAVAVAFAGANPNSDLRHETGFLSVEKRDGTRIADDSHEATVIEFAKDGVSTTTTITWDTSGAEPGEYVIRYRASSRGIGGNLTPFEGEASVTVG